MISELIRKQSNETIKINGKEYLLQNLDTQLKCRYL